MNSKIDKQKRNSKRMQREMLLKVESSDLPTSSTGLLSLTGDPATKFHSQ